MSEPGIPVSVHDFMTIIFGSVDGSGVEIALRVQCDGSTLLVMGGQGEVRLANVYWLLEDEVLVCPHCVVEETSLMLSVEEWTEARFYAAYRGILSAGRAPQVRLIFTVGGWHPSIDDAREELWAFLARRCPRHCR